MPGEVVAKHADIENECAKCHVAFDKPAQDRLCLACHKDIAADREEKRGYHGLEPSARTRSCKDCHTEHKGRDAEIVPLDSDTFRHRYTDMPLRGVHARVECDGCHVAGKRHREAPSKCIGCHADDDPHKGSVGTACDSCHDESTWKEARFDHGTAFRLEGKHRDADCEGCHATKRYKPTARACSACHAKDDKHRGGLGQACESCHTPQNWSAAKFDHARQTTFPLIGRHTGVDCGRCHTAAVAPERTNAACHGCHQRDDAHQGRFGRRCEICHTPDDWHDHTFDHAKSTGYTLRGRHREIGCVVCHQGNPYEEHLQTACYNCHRGEDVHHGRQGTRCDRCHDEGGWSRGVLFDHDSTTFALLGAHGRTTCTQCHLSPRFDQVARECIGCHAAEDVHKGKLGSKCERCHEASSFKVTHKPEDE
jgi:hypothetical protein